MSKVLVDRELLDLLRNFTFLHDDGCAGALRGNIDKALAAQPAEAEGVRDYLTEFAEGEVEAKTAIEELQDALSAVTAERDAANSRLHEVAVACATAEQERETRAAYQRNVYAVQKRGIRILMLIWVLHYMRIAHIINFKS